MKSFYKIALSMLVIALSLMFVSAASVGAVPGAVYTMTNDPAGNHVIRYDRGEDGALTNPSYFATNGLGSGTGLGNQGGLALSEEGNMLLVVNAGSNEISAFKVKPNGLKLTDKISSGGILPISITIHENLVYVLNAGGKGNIMGFHLDDGKLSMISRSSRPLSGTSAGADEISFNPDGNVLVVTETATNKIDTYVVKENGLTKSPDVQNSVGTTPFGFAFDNRGQLIVSEAFGGVVGASAVSSYNVDKNGILATISGSVPDLRTAACWLVVTDNGKLAYTNNAHDGTTSSYKISNAGKLTLLKSIAATPGAGNIDLALSDGSKFLYSLNSGSHTITGLMVKSDGSLTPIVTVSAPVGADGLAAR
jgi:6-phosphogluconolactonase